MALVFVNGRPYYTKSVRYGRRVTSISYGPAFGDLARCAAAVDRQEREGRRIGRMRRCEERRERSEARQAAIQERKDLRERLDAIDRSLAAYCRRVTKDVDAVMAAQGFHKHARGQWRRRRNPMSDEPAEIDVRELARRAEQGDQIAIGELAYHASRVLKPLDAFSGELARTVVEPMLIGMVAEKYDPLQDVVAAKLEALRREFAPRGSSVAERLLAERAALNWLHTMILERDRAELLQSSEAGHDVDPRKMAMVDQCLSRAQARLERALTALAKVKRLNLPVVVNQINVGGRVNGIQIGGE
jgi:hypothetical protein